jgi:hypothetical protein
MFEISPKYGLGPLKKGKIEVFKIVDKSLKETT